MATILKNIAQGSTDAAQQRRQGGNAAGFVSAAGSMFGLGGGVAGTGGVTQSLQSLRQQADSMMLEKLNAAKQVEGMVRRIVALRRA
jgi:hypothetical protein